MPPDNQQKDEERKPRRWGWAVFWFAVLILGIAAIFALIDYLFSL